MIGNKKLLPLPLEPHYWNYCRYIMYKSYICLIMYKEYIIIKASSCKHDWKIAINNPTHDNHSKTDSKTEFIISLFDSNRSNSCFPSVCTMCLHNFSISSIPRIESVDSFKQFTYCVSNSSSSTSPFCITGCHFMSISSFS